jgi:hypothetical protein
MTSVLGVNERVSGTLGITVKMTITSDATNFIKYILAFLAYGESSFVKTELNIFSHALDGYN